MTFCKVKSFFIGVAVPLLFAGASIVTAQTLPAGVTPQMAQQLQNMSPAQQQALAQQYGVSLPGAAPQNEGPQEYNLGEAGERLKQASKDAAGDEKLSENENENENEDEGLLRSCLVTGAHFSIKKCQRLRRLMTR